MYRCSCVQLYTLNAEIISVLRNKCACITHRSGVCKFKIVLVISTVLQAGKSRVKFRTVSPEFFTGTILPAALWTMGQLRL